MIDRPPKILDTRWLAILFLICALPTGIRLALLTPMGQVADEPAHIARADGLLYGQIFGHRIEFTDPATHVTFPVSGVQANIGIVTASFSELPSGLPHPLTAQRLKAAQAVPWSDQTMFDSASNTVQYFPFFYLPGSIGIGIGRIVGLSPLNALFAGRLMMLASYLAMGFAALSFATWGKGVLFLLLTMPMALSLGASFNQDGQLLAATALAGALFTRNPTTAPKWRLSGIVVMVLIIGSEPPYGLLLFAALLPLARPHLLRRAFRLSWFALPPIVWVALMMAISLVPFIRPAYQPGPLWPGSPGLVLHGTSSGDNLRVLLAHPLEIILLPLKTTLLQWNIWLRSAVGVLGWLTITLHRWQYDGWYIAAIAALAGILAAPNEWKSTPGDALLIVSLIATTIIAVEISQYLSWTNVGARSIGGTSGRYFLPFLPFLLFAIPRLGLKIDRALKRLGSAQTLEFLSAIPAVVMAGLDIYALPAVIVRVFHT